MAQLGVAGSKELETGGVILLPLEHEEKINGVPKMVPIEYFGEIISSKEKTTQKSGEKFLEVHFGVDFNGDRADVKDALFYKDTAIWKLSKLINLLELNKKTVCEEDFIGRFMWITVMYNEYEGAGGTMRNNQTKDYIRAATKEEVEKLSGPPPDSGEITFP